MVFDRYAGGILVCPTAALNSSRNSAFSPGVAKWLRSADELSGTADRSNPDSNLPRCRIETALPHALLRIASWSYNGLWDHLGTGPQQTR